MKKVISNIKKNRRGFTVAEVVVAMTVIIIVSGATLLLVASQANAETVAVQTIEATNIAENAIECFRYTESTGATFTDVFKKDNIGLDIVTDETDENKYTVEKDGLTVSIEISVDDITGEKTIIISAKNANGKTILGTTTYTFYR